MSLGEVGGAPPGADGSSHKGLVIDGTPQGVIHMFKGLRAPWTRRSRKPSDISIRRAWDRERARATSPSHQAEIDAIFSRYL